MGLRPARVFISYAPEDAGLLRQLENHLKPLMHGHRIKLWHDGKVPPGVERSSLVDSQIDDADLILLLFSPDYYASDPCYSRELPRALERQSEGSAQAIPILLRPVSLGTSDVASLQTLPRDGRAVTSWPNLDEAFLQVADGIRQALDHYQEHSLPARVERLSRENHELRMQQIRLEAENRRLREEQARSPEPPRASSPTGEQSTLDEFGQVRHGYRRLFLYHRRTFALMGRLSAELQAEGLEFVRWDPVRDPMRAHTTGARTAKSSTKFFEPGYSPWDFLPGNALALVFGGATQRVHLEFIADTGCKGHDPADFDPVTTSKSQLWVSLWSTGSPAPDWTAAWNGWMQLGGDSLCDGSDHAIEVSGDTYLYRYKEVDLAQIVDEQGLSEWVVSPVRRWLRRHRVPTAVRVLPMSRGEFAQHADVVRFLNELMGPASLGKYYYRSVAMNAGKGAVVLFQYDNAVVGHAVLKSDGKVPSLERADEGYQGHYLFDPETIKIYRRPVAPEDLNQVWSGITLSNAMHDLEPGRYLRYAALLKERGFV